MLYQQLARRPVSIFEEITERLREDDTRFDFEMGSLIKCPCKRCKFQN